MALTNTYLINLLENVKKRNQGEPEFIQAVTEVIETSISLSTRDPISLRQAFLTDSLSLKDRSFSVFLGLTTTARYR